MKLVQVWTNPVKGTPHGFLLVYLCDSDLHDIEIEDRVKSDMFRYGFSIQEMKIEEDKAIARIKTIRLRNEIEL